MSSYDLNAFNSPNFLPLVNGTHRRDVKNLLSQLTFWSVGIDIIVNWNDVIRQTGLRRFKAHKSEFKINENHILH